MPGSHGASEREKRGPSRKYIANTSALDQSQLSNGVQQGALPCIVGLGVRDWLNISVIPNKGELMCKDGGGSSRDRRREFGNVGTWIGLSII
jgi:hypothetical protein